MLVLKIKSLNGAMKVADNDRCVFLLSFVRVLHAFGALLYFAGGQKAETSKKFLLGCYRLNENGFIER